MARAGAFVKKPGFEEEIHARLREVTRDARKLREDLQRELRTNRPRTRPTANDAKLQGGPNRSNR